MRTILGFISGAFIGMAAIVGILITLDDGDEIIKQTHDWVNK